MDSRAEEKEFELFTPPHKAFTSFGDRCGDNLMSLTYEHPYAMKWGVYIMGGASIALTSVGVIPSIPKRIRGAAVLLGVGGTALSFTMGFLQHKVFGFPTNHQPLYKNDFYAFRGASATLLVDDEYFPRLNIKSKKPFDAGYVEGHILGEAIKANLDATDIFFKFIYMVIGFPGEEKFNAYLNDILKVIPEQYKEEMRGKVVGYNKWLEENYPDAKPLTFELLTLLQVVADYRNYTPFQDCRFAPIFHELGCTSANYRVGDYTVFLRVLDWLGYNKVPYFIEIERAIGNTPATIDIAHPLLTGVLTVRNKQGLFFQMNVANGRKVRKPEGIPAVFFNRLCAEKVKRLSDLEAFLKEHKPLGAYDLNVTDGDGTKSYQLLQDLIDPEKHIIKELKQDKNNPQLFVDANKGIEEKNGEIKPLNYRDSNEREENIHAFFNHPSTQHKLKEYIAKQKDEKPLSEEDVEGLIKTGVEIARLKLVDNPASVVCGLFAFKGNKMIDARVASDNLYAARTEFSKFKRLRS